MQRSLPYQKYPRTEQGALMQGGMNPWIVSCLVAPTSYSTAPPPQPRQHPTCPMQPVSWPALALLTSCALTHVESRASGKPQHSSAEKRARSPAAVDGPICSPTTSWDAPDIPCPSIQHSAVSSTEGTKDT